MAAIGGPTSAINLSDSWGSGLAGVFVALVFYGIGILQIFLYYECYTKDSIVLKSLVAWVFILDTLHTLLISAGIWQYFVVHFGDDEFLAYTHAPLLISIVITSVVSTTVQSFFIYRIWFLMRSRFRWVFPAVQMPFVVAQLVLGVFFVVVTIAFHGSLSAVDGPLLNKTANALNGIAIAVDIAITLSLCTLLAMGRTGFADTDRMLLRLIIVSVNTGLSSALFALLTVILKIIYPTELICTALYYPLCTVYCNTLLANLNARLFVRGSSETQQLGTLPSLVYRHTFTSVDVSSERVVGIEALPAVNV